MPETVPSVITQVNVTYLVGTIPICAGATNDLSSLYNTTILRSDAMLYTKVKMTKSFNSVGQEANYTFNVLTVDQWYLGNSTTYPRVFF